MDAESSDFECLQDHWPLFMKQPRHQGEIFGMSVDSREKRMTFDTVNS